MRTYHFATSQKSKHGILPVRMETIVPDVDTKKLVAWLDAEIIEMARIGARCRDGNPRHSRHVYSKAEAYTSVLAKIRDMAKQNDG